MSNGKLITTKTHSTFPTFQKHNKHFDVEVEPEMEPEPSSELEPHSPYRKRPPQLQPDLKTTVSIDLTESNSLSAKQKNAAASKNGHYELVSTSRPTSQKRARAKINNASANSENWPKCAHQCSMKQNSTAVYEQCITKPHVRTHHKSLSNRILSLKRENKTTQTLSIVVGGFIVCWLPFFIWYLITPFLPDKAISETLTTILTWLGWFNSAMNPFIYAFYSVDFRAAFWRLTLRRFFKNSTKAPYSSNAMSIKR